MSYTYVGREGVEWSEMRIFDKGFLPHQVTLNPFPLCFLPWEAKPQWVVNALQLQSGETGMRSERGRGIFPWLLLNKVTSN
jgi:hypothetical protein